LSDTILTAASEEEFNSLWPEVQDALTRRVAAEALQAELEVAEFQRQVNFTNRANLRNRVLPFVGQVNDESVEQAVDVLARWARESNDPIVVRFTSPGGAVMSGLVMFDTIRSIVDDGTPVKTVVLGHADSMAAILLQAGSERIIGPHAYIMIHEGRQVIKTDAVIVQKYADVVDDGKFGLRLNKDMAAILAERSKLSAREILNRMKKGDWSLGTSECLQYGFADKVGYK